MTIVREKVHLFVKDGLWTICVRKAPQLRYWMPSEATHAAQFAQKLNIKENRK